jgi:hypothetical protein
MAKKVEIKPSENKEDKKVVHRGMRTLVKRRQKRR